MTSKTVKKIEKKALKKIPLGGVFDLVDAATDVAVGQAKRRYKVDKRIKDFKEDAAEFRDDAIEKVEEFEAEAVRKAYAAKRAFFRTIVEGILLASGVLALVLGVIMAAGRLGAALDAILIAYGLAVTLYVYLKVKTSEE